MTKSNFIRTVLGIIASTVTIAVGCVTLYEKFPQIRSWFPEKIQPLMVEGYKILQGFAQSLGVSVGYLVLAFIFVLFVLFWVIRRFAFSGMKRGRHAGESCDVAIDGLQYKLVWCPPGSFYMGTSDKKNSAIAPKHRVRLTKGFWCLRYPVTQLQWVKMMNQNHSSFKGDNLPVERVSQRAAQNFCGKIEKELRKQKGFGKASVRLPSEAEWEYLCSAGNQKGFRCSTDDAAWYSQNSNGKTHPVGTKKPNAWGIYDTLGNVKEHVLDYYGEISSRSVKDPRGPQSGAYTVVRGGSWNTGCLPWFRDKIVENDTSNEVGFRFIVIKEDR